MSERWLPIPGYEGLYSVSDLGRVRRDAGGRGAHAGKILRPGRHRRGYLMVALCRDGKMRMMTVHRLVAAAFIGPCPDGMEVAHADGDPTNNRLGNLRYASRSENLLDCHRYGGRVTRQKLTLAQVAEIRQRLAAGETQRSIASAFGVSQPTIRDIKHGRSWSHRLDQELVA